MAESSCARIPRRPVPENNFHQFIEKPREFIDIYRIFSKFHILEQADRRLHHTGIPRIRAGGKCGQMRSRLGGRSESVAMIFGATRGAGSENGFRPGEAKPTGGLSSIPHRRGNRAAANAGNCAFIVERWEALDDTCRSKPGGAGEGHSASTGSIPTVIPAGAGCGREGTRRREGWGLSGAVER